MTILNCWGQRMKRVVEYLSETVLPEQILNYIKEYEQDWLFRYRYEPDKQFIGVEKLRKNIVNWFDNHQKETENERT